MSSQALDILAVSWFAVFLLFVLAIEYACRVRLRNCTNFKQGKASDLGDE